MVGEVAGLFEHVRATGEWLRGHLEARGFEVRGAGLLLGVVVENAPALQTELLEKGFIVNAPNATTIRLAPPLIITQDELAPFIEEMETHS